MFDLLFNALDVLADVFDGTGDALADTMDVAADHIPESLVDTIATDGPDLANDVMFGSGSTYSTNFWGIETVTHPDGSWERIN